MSAKADITKLLEHVKGRRSSRRYGIGLKSSYMNDLGHCFQGGHCPSKLFRNAPSGDALEQLFKDAEQQFTYCNKDLLIEEAKDTGEADDGAILSFDFVATSKKKDRDGDVLEPAGAILDEKMPLLWQHIPFEPIGRMTQILDRNSRRIRMRAVVLGTDLGKDAAILIRGGALRISHGFMPLDYEAMYKDERFDGWHITKYEMMEVSVVSIPSNTDAIITAYSQSKFTHPAVKGWAKSLYDSRPALIASGIDLKSLPPGTIIIGSGEKHACGCETKTPKLPETDEEKAAVAKGHGCVVGACGHVVSSCRCHSAKLLRGHSDEICGECMMPGGQKSVVPYAATTAAPKDHPWDAGEARKRLEAWSGMDKDKDSAEAQGKYRKAFAIVDGDASNLGSYKLPHHDIIDGKLMVVWSGVKAAMGVIDGGRGGLSASDSDKSGARAHIAKHYKQFDEEPPEEGKSVEIEVKGGMSKEHRKMMDCAHELAEAAHDHDQTGTVPKALLADSMNHIKAIMGGENDANDKAMSQEKRDHLKSAHTLMCEAYGHGDTGLVPKAILGAAVSYVKGVMQAHMPDGDGDDDDDDDDDKSLESLMVKTLNAFVTSNDLPLAACQDFAKRFSGLVEVASEEHAALTAILN